MAPDPLVVVVAPEVVEQVCWLAPAKVWVASPGSAPELIEIVLREGSHTGNPARGSARDAVGARTARVERRGAPGGGRGGAGDGGRLHVHAQLPEFCPLVPFPLVTPTTLVALKVKGFGLPAVSAGTEESWKSHSRM